jgi:Protein of unknown function (DUF3040)
MALSMDEQRMLAEIEQRLAAEEPGLAARLTSFRRPGPGAALRSPRVRIVGSVFTVALVAIISLMIYAMIPLRAANTRAEDTSRPQASPAKAAMMVPGNSSTTSSRTTGTKSPSNTHTTAKTAQDPVVKSTSK